MSRSVGDSETPARVAPVVLGLPQFPPDQPGVQSCDNIGCGQSTAAASDASVLRRNGACIDILMIL